MQLLVFVGTKLEHIITELGGEVAQRHVAVPGELLVKPSDHHFWFNKPRLVLSLIHIILFQNSFEIAVFFWVLVYNILTTAVIFFLLYTSHFNFLQHHHISNWQVLFGFNSCIMGQIGYIVPRLIIGYISLSQKWHLWTFISN